jgi:hypothetical protein
MHVALPVLPQPGHVELRERHPRPDRQGDEELAKYRKGLKTMSGGFTLSGGEALMQDRFAVKLLTAARGMGIHTALDTNGYLGDRLSDAELEAADLVLLDIKGWDPERHRRLTGMEIGPTLDFARRLARQRRRCGCASCWSLASPTTPMRSRRSLASRRSSATWSAWTSCPSTRWADTNGSASASSTSCRRRAADTRDGPAAADSFRSAGLLAY